MQVMLVLADRVDVNCESNGRATIVLHAGITIRGARKKKGGTYVAAMQGILYIIFVLEGCHPRCRSSQSYSPIWEPVVSKG